MSRDPNLRAIVTEAKRKGYFDPSDFPNVRFRQPELLELMEMLRKKSIPYGKPEIDINPVEELASADARRIISSLRRGIPSPQDCTSYSVGRQDLLRNVERDLQTVAEGTSLVRFVNADIGRGKTHALYLLRELAYARDFAVSLVTLSQSSCPLHDFMRVYGTVMWELRTRDQRRKPALSNIIDRWVEDIRALSPSRIRQIVEHELPPSLCQIMAAYVDASNLFRPNETRRQQILKFLSGERVLTSDRRRMGISFTISSHNALQILSEMATTIRYIGFKGICILFDEAEAIHSFSRSGQRDRAYANLLHIIDESQAFPHCYFLYATTPSFFESYGSGALIQRLGAISMMELEPIDTDLRYGLGKKIANVYARAFDWDIPSTTYRHISKVAELSRSDRIGNYVRQMVAILDEERRRI